MPKPFDGTVEDVTVDAAVPIGRDVWPEGPDDGGIDDDEAATFGCDAKVTGIPLVVGAT